MEYFKKRVEVEISSKDNGFQGSLYAETMIKKLRNNKIIVEYKDLVEDNAGQRPLRNSKEQLDFRPSELRLHREWVHGSWALPLEVESEEVKDVLILPKPEAGNWQRDISGQS
ncbi:hypothetical protein ACH5RR_037229 [Cinchona calisaya]|uniref:Agenet domain-containing protein n=1 Tax=Cinchona calisaya TaxID=153742 RepID=A0ABD2YAD6_9GENT